MQKVNPKEMEIGKKYYIEAKNLDNDDTEEELYSRKQVGIHNGISGNGHFYADFINIKNISRICKPQQEWTGCYGEGEGSRSKYDFNFYEMNKDKIIADKNKRDQIEAFEKMINTMGKNNGNEINSIGTQLKNKYKYYFGANTC